MAGSLGGGSSVCGGGVSNGVSSLGGAQPAATVDALRRAAPPTNNAAQLALVTQAAWPGLQSPRIKDALSTLMAGIAVLEPTPVIPACTSPTRPVPGYDGEPSPGSMPMPHGCFALFHRHGGGATAKAAAAAAAAAAVTSQCTEAQRPVLLKLSIVDGVVNLRFIRSRRPGAGGNTPRGNEQHVRVAALCAVHPPLRAPNTANSDTGGGASPFASTGGMQTAQTIISMESALEDEVLEDRWLQLVGMDGGLLRLSACSPADHARLVLGVNAALLLAAGATNDEALLVNVPLRSLTTASGGGVQGAKAV
ncbi:hypothetical protein GPECTOR_4g736 [Gonium pectorale]|uniref:Uncharacterized protein n=1 Tax=Gonium pectorale TaxID=33097 RepID=A0A150GZA2_GONPE|nr:hypothetical protein GPECTOR_4g736 [Gonium pectorale]|eukprot:KXZ54670.1 hypothetical protein GPECTOR_4g736 [Gonium pectorale]